MCVFLLKALFLIFFSRTIQKRLGRYFTANGGVRRWIDQLKNVTRAYNETVHNTTGMKPNDVTRKNASLLFDFMELQRKRIARTKKNKFELGDLVRIPINFKKKKEFVKYGRPAWTVELYQVSRIEFGTHRPTYFLCDLTGKPLAQRFYSNELNLVSSFAELD